MPKRIGPRNARRGAGNTKVAISRSRLMPRKIKTNNFMLPKGSIARIYEYYFTTPRYGDEVLRAMREFFDRPDLDRGASLEMNDKSEGLFNEWFLYDFVLPTGETPLQNFVKENSLGLSAVEMELYKNILKTNIYGLYEVKKIDVDEGLALKNLQTGKESYVREKSLTRQVQPGSVFFGRIGKVDDHYELIGADTFSIQAAGDEIMSHFHGMKFKITPKFAHDIWKMQYS